MPLPATGPTEPDAFLAVCGHTHLFPGARCRLQGLPDPEAFAARPRPGDVLLRFSDAVATDAEVRTDGPALAVPAYTTAAGTPIDGRAWLVREFAGAGDEVELTIGGIAPA
ncbi:hypothetical protein EES43_03050 [Streptomyces sp. ADI96-02]|uniref:hypothetical protein n=1 Tax=Streptomyces sp. ADI96-02 TaxID=1522760 RepID=UPI000F54F7C6|nr:hypothetical protein [Streptomyces sp. ADI96-02]RPK67478.1 hypothetical protein EES43_03050 [Streptomyces sp. ADI96-02]